MERGYRALKIDPFGTGHFELDHRQSLYAVSLIEAVRDAIGPDAELMLEMHGRFSPPPPSVWRGARAVQPGLAGGAGAAGEPQGAGEGGREGRHAARHR
ncbi:hypothetical protein SHKM778_75570 [Streptomyces sp. KM77-8]|uniref:Enolase C-terminal domain-containing protein n=1 Tax=Streptomyces haneummycinicus TaxID=3074435 RepID=A0AAT9HUB0_9ACTN